MAYKYSKNNKYSGKGKKTLSTSPSTRSSISPTYDLQSMVSLDTNDVILQDINTLTPNNTPLLTPNNTPPLKHESTDTLIIQDLPFKTIDKTFGRKDDYIELHIYNSNDQIIHSDLDFKEYIIPENQDCYPLSKHIEIDPNQILTSKGYITGKFKIKLNILKNKIFDSENYPFLIKEISSDRREIRSISDQVTNLLFDPAIQSFISEMESSVYFKEFSLNFGDDILIPAINILLNKNPFKHELLLKTLKVLPNNIKIQNNFKVVEEIIDPIFINVNLGDPIISQNSTELLGPNFTIDIKQNQSVPSGFKTYDDILSYDITSSYQHLLSKLEDDSAEININYDYIRPVSESNIEVPYHFENFTHFSSATERLKNFKYKLKLIELYDSKINTITSIPGATSTVNVVLDAKEDINSKKEKLIKGFDGYEQFLYFTSGSQYSWPKQNPTKPYNLYSITSSIAKNWLGTDQSSFGNYGGQLLSASLYDRQNPHNLNKLIPSHIVDNDDNNLYVNFVNMVGQHFDNIWTYIKAIKDIHNSSNTKGISKDLVYYQLKGLGIDTFDQFENTQLTEYMLGIESGSNKYNVGFTFGENSVSGSGVNSETLITASNDPSIPKGDIAKEIWKRIYHNAPYLLKTKGTERGIKALMSCYGLPSSILNIKEYGGSTPTTGPLKDLDTSDTYKTFTYPKSSYALEGSSGTTGYFLRTNWSSSLTNTYITQAEEEKGKAVEFRIKPNRSITKQHLFSLSGSSSTGTSQNNNYDIHLYIEPYIGTDISSSGDSEQYGRLKLDQSSNLIASSSYFPIYNKDFWNVFIQANKVSGGNNGLVTFGAYQANFNKNIFAHTTSSLINNYRFCFGSAFKGAKHAYFGGLSPNPASSYDNIDIIDYSGSIQEIKIYFGELLTHNTLKKHALEPFMYAGNSVSSSYNNMVARLPLGSNGIKNSSSFHPNIDVDFIGSGVITNVETDMVSQEWKEIVEDHHLPTPDTVGASMTSDKVRIDEGTIDENILHPTLKTETSTLDRQPPDYEDLGIFLSPTNELNEDIVYTLGSFRMDDYIGSPLPSAQTASKYEDLKTISDLYFKKVKRRYNYWDYVKQIQYIDHTLFKIIENFVPFKSNLKTGLLIEPHFLERNKFKRNTPIRTDGQTMIEGTHQNFEFQISTDYQNNKLLELKSGSKAFGFGDSVAKQWDPGSYVTYHSNFSNITSSKGEKIDQGTNTTIKIYDDYLDPFTKDPNTENAQSNQSPIKPFNSIVGKPTDYVAHKSSILLGNMIGGRKSNKYYRYKEYRVQTSSLY
jgi:hypothetical protein